VLKPITFRSLIGMDTVLCLSGQPVCASTYYLPMNVGDSIRLAIDSYDHGELEAAMLHACNAVDGTADKVYPELKTKVGKRFTNLIRRNHQIIGLMTLPGVNVEEMRWPVHIESTLGKGEWPDTADLIYVIHRCHHGHGAELPEGFALAAERMGPTSHLYVEDGAVRLPWNVIFGLIAIAVFEPVNVGQRVRDDQYLTWGDPEIRFEINDWWGRKDDFVAQLMTQPRPSVTLDFGQWMQGVPQLPSRK
jgi:hypothetical protein